MMTVFFDAHCHIAPEALSVLEAGWGGVHGGEDGGGRLVCAVGREEWKGLEVLGRGWGGTWVAFGVHPWRVVGAGMEEGGWGEELEEYLARNPEAWVGEVGLDGRRGGIGGVEDQVEVLGRQLEAAARWGRGVSVHCVGGWGVWESLLGVLDRRYFGVMGSGGGRVLVHGFGGPYQMVGRLVERGAYFSVGGWMVEGGGRRLWGRVGLFPVERVVLESDGFLWPGGDMGLEMGYAAEWLGGVWGMDREGVCERIGVNVARMLEPVVTMR